MEILVTVFTPTFNRAHVLTRVFKSLTTQSYKNFEWIIIDDGSSDNTKEVVDTFIQNSKFPIIYIFQNNSGKHIAMNRCVKIAKGSLFIIADSDDSFIPNAIEILISNWMFIPNEKKDEFKGISCRCLNAETNVAIGKNFPSDTFDSNDLDIVFKYKCAYEMWGILRTDILKQYPFPEKEGLHFYPEAVIWQTIARKYKTRYINTPLRYYYSDQKNSLTNKKGHRSRENIYLWCHYINNIFDYFSYDIFLFFKAFVGLSRDGLLLGMSFSKIINLCNGILRKFFCALFYPIGFILYKNIISHN